MSSPQYAVLDDLQDYAESMIWFQQEQVSKSKFQEQEGVIIKFKDSYKKSKHQPMML